MNNIVRREYIRLREKGWGAKSALSAAKTIDAFKTAEADGLVRIQVKPDDSSSMDDLKGDVFNPKVNPEIPAARLKAEEHDFEERANREGVWGIVAQWRPTRDDDWETTDSVWGFVSNDYVDSGYDTDVMNTALEALEGSRRNEDLRHDAKEGLRSVADQLASWEGQPIADDNLTEMANEIRRYVNMIENTGV